MDLDANLPELPFPLSPPGKKYTLDEAVLAIHDIQLRLVAVEDYRLRLNWCFGLVVVHTERPWGIRRKIVEELVRRVHEEYGISVNVTLLYQCQRLYRIFDGKLDRFEQWIRGNKILLGRSVNWSDVIEQLLGGRNNPKIIGREEADRRDYLDAERGVEALERLVDRRSSSDEEIDGALEGIRQSVEGLALTNQNQRTPVRDEAYRAFVRRYGCVVCEHPAEAHHAFGQRAQSVKPSDYACVPLCRTHHGEIHSRGTTAVEEKYGVSFFETAFNLFHRYATGRWLTMRLEKVR